MRILIALHILGAATGLCSGLIALSTGKGGTIHRLSGKVFVGGMFTMCLAAILIATARSELVNLVAGTLTGYLVATAWTTVRPIQSDNGPMIERAFMVTALVVGIAAIGLGPRLGRPGVPLLPFGVMAILAGIGDFKTLRAGKLTKVPRLTRHLWRMCLAFWIATASFFWGPRARVEAVLPVILVKTPLLSIPVVAVLLSLFYWLWRVKRDCLRAIPHAEQSSPIVGTPTS